MSLLSQRIIEDVEAVHSSRPAPIRLAHRVLDKATLLTINATARLSPITNRLPDPLRDFVHSIPVSLLKWSAMARADYAGGRNMPSLEALRKVAQEARETRPTAAEASGQCATCANGSCEAHNALAYHWYVFAESAAVLQFALLYFDKVNSVWEALRERWGEKFITRGANGNMLSPKGSLTDVISDAARDGVLVAAYASERFLCEYKWLVEGDLERRDLLGNIKRRYEAPQVVAAWAGEQLPEEFLKRFCSSST